jgi:predicted metal-dependent phosphoesterase TrpH
MKYDLHIHSRYSADGVLDPSAIVDIARKNGLSGIAITDHNTISGALAAKKYETEDLQVIIGAEITTEKGEITGLFLSREITSRKAEAVIYEIKSQGGLVVIPHPFDDMRHAAFHPSDKDSRFIDALEVFNARCVFLEYNRRAWEFARRHRLPALAGSDAHFANEIGNAGIISYSRDIKEAIINKNNAVFGNKSRLINHVGTKVIKAWKNTVKSG